jgi:putative redox protein
MPDLEATVVWDEGLRFTGTGARSRFPVKLDSSAGGGGFQGATPTEALLVALGGCTGMDVISILGKMRQEVTAYEVRVRGEQASDHPKVFEELIVEHRVTGRNLDTALVEKAVRLSETKYCPVSNTLARGVKVRFTFEVIGGQ